MGIRLCFWFTFAFRYPAILGKG